MPTTVSSTIGAGGTYSTPALWEAASPADLRAGSGVDEIWQGKLLNQVHAAVTIAGTLTDATHYTELTTDAGASFMDNVNAQTNALRVNSSNGAVMHTTVAYATVITVNQDFVRLSKMQAEITGAATGSAPVISNQFGTSTLTIDNVILESPRTNVLNLFSANNLIRNSLIVCRGSSQATIATLKGAGAINCTFAVPSDKTAATVALTGQYASAAIKNCAIFGVAALSTGFAPTYTTCATNGTGTTGMTGGLAYTSATFANVLDATRDYRLVAGSALLNAATADSVNAANDIVGTPRPQGGAYDISCWELVVASGTWKTTNGLATASIKTVNGLAKASIKTNQGLTP